MKFVLSDDSLPKDSVFTKEQLLALTPNHIARWLTKRAYDVFINKAPAHYLLLTISLLTVNLLPELGNMPESSQCLYSGTINSPAPLTSATRLLSQT